MQKKKKNVVRSMAKHRTEWKEMEGNNCLFCFAQELASCPEIFFGANAHDQQGMAQQYTRRDVTVYCYKDERRPPFKC